MKTISRLFHTCVLLPIVLTGRLAAQSPALTRPLQGIVKARADATLDASSAPSVISEDRLRTMIELRLRMAGIRMLTVDEDLAEPTSIPIAGISIVLLPNQTQSGLTLGYSFATTFSLTEIGPYWRNNARIRLTLWTETFLNISSKDALQSQVESTVTQLLDSFLNAWLRENPRQ